MAVTDSPIVTVTRIWCCAITFFCLQNLWKTLLNLQSFRHHTGKRLSLRAPTAAWAIGVAIIAMTSEQKRLRNRQQTRSVLSFFRLSTSGCMALTDRHHHWCCCHLQQRENRTAGPSNARTQSQDPALHTDQQLPGHNKRDHCNA